MRSFFSRIQIFMFAFFLLLVPLFWLTRDGNYDKVSHVEGRELSHFSDSGLLDIKQILWLSWNLRFAEADEIIQSDWTSHVVQNQFEMAASDQFPFRIALIRLAKGFDRALIHFTYAFLKDPVIPVDAYSEIYISKDGTTVMKGFLEYSAETQTRLDERIDEISIIANEYPEKNVYVFYFERLAYSSLDPRLDNIPSLDGGRSFAYFKEHLPDTVTVGTMELTSLDDYNENFFHTDHHWNIRGAWRAYQGIYSMVSQHYTEISPMNESMAYKSYPDLLFLGTYARDTLYPFEPEVFEIGEVKLPAYEVYTRDFPIEYNHSEQYNAGIYSKDPLVSHYAEYFGANSEYLQYYSNNSSGRNLLLIGTSYKIPIQPWIASHYHMSYFVNLANFENFSMDTFLEDHPVDDIIILTDMNELLDSDLAIMP